MATLPITLTDIEGFLWDITTAGNISNGTNDAYDGGMGIVNFSPSSTVTLEDNSREVVMGPVVSGDIEITRKVYVPDSGTMGYARFLDSVTNTGTTTTTYTLTISSNLGSDSSTTIIASSNGDTTLDTADKWVVTDDTSTGLAGGDSAVAHVFGSTSGNGATSITMPYSDTINYTYELTLDPGETKSILHFGVQALTAADAQAIAEYIVTEPQDIFSGMSDTEMQQLVNFTAVAPASTYAITDATGLSGMEGSGTDTTVSFTVTRTGDLTSVGSVEYTLTGSGTHQADGNDFTGGTLPSGTISFAAGVQTQTVTVSIAGDSVYEADETFQVTLSGATNGAVSSTQASAAGTIINDDPVSLTSDDDTYTGTTGNDMISGDRGDDTMSGGAGNDWLLGKSGDDYLYGGSGNDILEGGLGDNFLYGGSGNDTLYATSKTGGTGDLVTTSNQTIIPSTQQSLSISITAPEATETGSVSVEGLVSRSAGQSGQVNIAYIIDHSGSMSTTFAGTSVGDLNGDGTSNSLMDAAIASFKSLTASLQSSGFSSSQVALIPFDTTASITYQGTLSSDTNANGIVDVVDNLSTLVPAGSTNYIGALDQAISFFTGQNGINYIFFVSDGSPDSTAFSTQVQTLIDSTGINATIKAIGLGSGANMSTLDLLDDNIANNSSIQVNDTSSFTAGLVAPPVSVADIDHVELYQNGELVATIPADQLVSTPLGLRFTQSITGLSETDNTITAKVIATDSDNTTVSVSQNIATGAGNNILLGGSGHDILVSGAGDDILNGGSGIDTASYDLATAAVKVNLGTIGWQATSGGGMDNLISIENLTGSMYNDILSGNAAGNVINGGSGSDTIDGGAGNDTIDGGAGNDKLIGGIGIDTVSYESAAAGVKVNLALTAAQATIGAGADTLSGFENLTGSSYNDTLTGNAAANVIIGGAGNDTINGGAGNDTIEGGTGNDKLIGNLGIDTVSYAGATAGVKVNLAMTAIQATIGAGADTLSGFENLTGSSYNDTLTGNAVANVINGGAGNDTINGGGGNDTILGGAGNDMIDGGAGNDKLIGGEGIDTVSYASAGLGVKVNLALTVAQSTLGAGSDTLLQIENLTGSNKNDTLIGNGAANVLNGLSGNDIINGGAGNDTIFGALGNDTIFGSLGNDTLTGGAGYDFFVFNTGLNALSNVDTITDFSAVYDTIRLENAVFTKLTTTGALSAANFKDVAVGTQDANDFILYNSTTGVLSYDADGSGSGAAIQFALLGVNTHPTITAADFVII